MSIEYLDKAHARLWFTEGTGKNRVRKSKRITYQGKKDAERQDREYQLEMQQRKTIDTSITVDKLLAWYIDSMEIIGLKATTIKGYRAAAKRLNMTFAGVKAETLTTYQVDDFVLKSVKSFRPKTIRNEVSLLNAAYTKAVRSGILSSNPCINVNLPSEKKKDIDILNAEEIARFCEALENEYLDFRVAVKLALFCGMRRSEILGLQAENVNMIFKTIGIHQTRHRINGNDVIQDTKTKTSARMLSIPKLLEPDLIELLKIRDGLLICNGFGEPLSPSTLEKQYRIFRERLGLDVSFHGLRHTHASLLHDSGVTLAEISAQLGHANLSTTLNIYTHIFNEATVSSKRIANAIDEKMSPKSHQEIKKEAETL